jgi:hypothetical protein
MEAARGGFPCERNVDLFGNPHDEALTYSPSSFVLVASFAMCYNRLVKKTLSVSMILVALFAIDSNCKAATIRGSVKEIHSGAARASAANQVTVTLYRGVLSSSDLQKVETFRTGIDGLYHFENIPKGEYTIHVQDPNVKEPNWGPAAYRRVSVADDNAVIELDPTVIDYK